jgi:hypothetical protein
VFDLWIDNDDPDIPVSQVPTTRIISTTAPLTGGGDLSADRTLALAASMPRGLIVKHELTTAFSTTGTHTTAQDDGLTVAFNELANRWYLVTVLASPYTPGGLNNFSITLLRNGVVVRTWDIAQEAIGNSYAHSMTFNHLVQGVAAAVTYKTQIRGSANTQVQNYARADMARLLLVQDIGGF